LSNRKNVFAKNGKLKKLSPTCQLDLIFIFTGVHSSRNCLNTFKWACTIPGVEHGTILSIPKRSDANIATDGTGGIGWKRLRISSSEWSGELPTYKYNLPPFDLFW
jgi:hypothetical protein